jgi:hypothetical protein
MGGSGAATCLEKVIYSKASTVSPDPHGRAPDPLINNPDLQGWSKTSTCARRTPRMGSVPPPPPWGVRIAHNGVPRFQDRTYSSLEQDPSEVRCRHVSRPGPVCIHSCSPPRRSPDAATWHTARDVSQRVEPDVRPLGYATSSFIVDKARRLSIPLADGVPPLHLLRPVHSAGRQ